jgi:hypothetical protein
MRRRDFITLVVGAAPVLSAWPEAQAQEVGRKAPGNPARSGARHRPRRDPRGPRCHETAATRELEDEARAHGVRVSTHLASKSEDIIQAVDGAAAEGPEALNVLASALLDKHRAQIIERTSELAAKDERLRM